MSDVVVVAIFLCCSVSIYCLLQLFASFVAQR